MWQPSIQIINLRFLNWSLSLSIIRLDCEDSLRSFTFIIQIHSINYGVCINFRLKNKKKTLFDLVEANMSETDYFFLFYYLRNWCGVFQFDLINKNWEWKWGMCQRDSNPTTEQTTAEGHQQVFNATRNSRTGGVLQLAPKHVTRTITYWFVFHNI